MWILNILNKLVIKIIEILPEKIIWHFSKKYIAGDKLSDAIEVSKNLNEVGYLTTVDLLGENITSLETAEENKQIYLVIIDAFEAQHIRGNYSLKPTFLGLLIDFETCYANVKEIVQRAAKFNNMIRIDMEDSSCTSLEIDLYKRLHREFPKNVGLVFQAYLKRTETDIRQLINLSDRANLNFRICKGIYKEDKKIAYKKYEEINRKFIELLELLFQHKIYVGIATHDRNLLAASLELIDKYNIPGDRYEFQMLYGVTPKRRAKLLETDNRVRVYIPFGKDWRGYSLRRFRENPKLTYQVMKSIFR